MKGKTREHKARGGAAEPKAYNADGSNVEREAEERKKHEEEIFSEEDLKARFCLLFSVCANFLAFCWLLRCSRIFLYSSSILRTG